MLKLWRNPSFSAKLTR